MGHDTSLWQSSGVGAVYRPNQMKACCKDVACATDVYLFASMLACCLRGSLVVHISLTKYLADKNASPCDQEGLPALCYSGA